MNQAKVKANSYSSEFKETAVKLAIDSDQSVAQTARDIGVNENTLHTWIGQYSKPTVAQVKTRSGEHIYDENKRLKKELAKVTQERDLLKKATAYFAREIV